MGKRFGIVGAGVIALFTIVACGNFGGSSDSSPSVGVLGGACYANGTCNAGLACVSSICKASSDKDASDGETDSSNATSDGSTIPRTGCPFTVSPTLEVSGCAFSASSGSDIGACVANQGPGETPSCNIEESECIFFPDKIPYLFFGCTTGTDCQSGTCDVCLTADDQTAECPVYFKLPSAGVVTSCSDYATSDCGAGGPLQICATDADCPPPSACNAARIADNGQIFGVCL